MSSPDFPLPVQDRTDKASKAKEGWVLLRRDQLTSDAIQAMKQQFHAWAMEELDDGKSYCIDYRVNETGTYYRLDVPDNRKF